MRLLNLDHGNFQVWSMPHGKYDIVFLTPKGTFTQLMAHNEQELKGVIHIWTDARYIYHALDHLIKQ